MKFFLDENFPKAAHEFLMSRRHEVIDIRGTPKEGSDDATLFEVAQAAGAVFLTTDRDFFHTVPHLYDCHCGVVVVALRQPGRKNILDKLDWFLRHYAGITLENKVFQLRDRACILLLPPDDVGEAGNTGGESSTPRR
ncbi:MAG TPA: DUF5615 family PIN-like protein [Candidatus Hydrogenedentes bacterium]|nr:DUF5615 family PIN-like protein [Candidatus Hydrogenedentota bacterium]HNT88313.1 DUF5615 family PIN-like protein [Candidatus Hydrogenedentota bacterium]